MIAGSGLGELLEVAVRLAVPILLAALGEIVAERAGVVNVGIEGMMLGGALASALVAYATGSAALGLAAGAAAGMALAALFAAVAIGSGGDLIIAGTGLNLVALGLTGFTYQTAFGRTGSALQVPHFAAFAVPGLSRLPLVGRAFFVQPVTTWIAVAATALVAVLFSRTGIGLRLRAAGEEPRAAAAAGASVARLRTGAALTGGWLAGLGGGALVLAHAYTFVEGMTAGRGFIALALVIFARYRPWGALGASLLFGAALALQYEMQALGLEVPYQFVRMVPYVATLAVLAFTSGRGVRMPAALGRDSG